MDIPPEVSSEEEEFMDLSDEEMQAAFKEAKSKMNEESSKEDGESSDEGDDQDLEESEDDDSTEDSDIDDDNDEVTEEPEEEPESADNSDEDKDVADSDKGTDTKEEVHTFKANGQEYSFTTKEVLDTFKTVYGQAMDYTKKMQAIAPHRKVISAMEENGINPDDINLLIDIKKGNMDAVQKLLKTSEIDPMSLDMDKDTGYQPKVYGRTDTQLRIDEVVDQISHDPEYAMTKDVVDRQWDEKSRQEFMKDPTLIRGLHEDIQDGIYAKVAPEAMKLKLLDGAKLSDLDYYIAAGKKLQDTEAVVSKQLQQEEERKKSQEAIKEKSKARKAAKPSKSKTGKKGAIDYLDEYEGYEEWRKGVEAST